jgi:hypothetical protein
MGTLKRGGVYLLRKGLPRDLALPVGEPQKYQETKNDEGQKENQALQ